MSIVSKYHSDNYISNQMGIPPFEKTDIVYNDNSDIATITYSRDGVVVGRLAYTYDSAFNVITMEREL